LTFVRFIASLLVVSALGACSQGFVRFPVTEEQQKQKKEDVTIIRLTDANIASFSKPARGYAISSLPVGKVSDYRIGSGDLLNVIVFDHPELMLTAGPGADASASGFSVQSDGTFNYPFIGRVEARGRSTESVRADIAMRLAEYIPDPQVEVRVVAFNSQRVVVAGEVKVPTSQPISLVPVTLITAINAAGGLTEAADTRAVSVQRGGAVHTIDLAGFLNAGIEQNNPVLRAGDVVTVPRRRVQEAYLLGQIQKPAVVDLSLEQITLTQALTRQGGLEEVRADARGVFVFRNVAGGTTVFQLETSSPTSLLLGTRFVLEPADVVYVVRSPLSRWNDTISALLPTVTAASAAQTLSN
jgi:polysaccharide export outer membrane protein